MYSKIFLFAGEGHFYASLDLSFKKCIFAESLKVKRLC